MFEEHGSIGSWRCYTTHLPDASKAIGRAESMNLSFGAVCGGTKEGRKEFRGAGFWDGEDDVCGEGGRSYMVVNVTGT